MLLLLQLYEHKVLTTHQIHELHFSSEHRARKRLLQLYTRHVLDRFRPHQHPGSQPHHYFLDDLGAKLVAGYLGVDVKELRFRKERIFRLARSRFLDHLRETNGFFTRLAFACRQSPHGLAFTGWYGERRADTMAARPDGLGVLQGPDRKIAFWLEIDRGTESHDRLEAKMHRYGRHGGRVDSDPRALLFCFHSEAREARTRRALWDIDGFLVATTTSERHRLDPLGANWLPVREGRRFSLVDVPLPPRGEIYLPGGQRLIPSRDDPHEDGW